MVKQQKLGTIVGCWEMRFLALGFTVEYNVQAATAILAMFVFATSSIICVLHRLNNRK
jgi:hypothetical protein